MSDAQQFHREDFSPLEVSQLASCHYDHVRRLVREGRLTAVRLGPRKMRITAASVVGYFGQQVLENVTVSRPAPASEMSG